MVSLLRAATVRQWPVDLHVVEWKQLQVSERGVPGAKVIEHQLNAHLVQALENLLRCADVADEPALRQFEFQRTSGRARLLEYACDMVDETGVAQRRGRQIDADAEVGLRRETPAPFAHHPARVLDRPAGDWHGETGFFRDRQKPVRPEHAFHRMPPAKQRLHANDVALAQIDDGLEQQQQLVSLERDMQVGLETHETQHVTAHC